LPATGALLLAAGGLVFAYLLGALPFGYLAARVKGVDIRAAGSGNIGATNVGRVCGRGWGAAVFALDAAKGFAAAGPLAWLVLRLGEVPTEGLLRAGLGPLYAAAVFSGHVWTVFLGFRGGKGVATGAGAILALEPVALAVGLGMWLCSIFLTRYVSVASMSAAVTVAGIAAARSLSAGRLGRDWPVWGLTALIAALVVLRHRANLGRLRRGEEPRVQFGSRRPAPAAATGASPLSGILPPPPEPPARPEGQP